jgi:hypothetical protein
MILIIQTLVTITETHWRRVNKREVGFVIMMKREMGSFLFAVVIDSYKCLDSVALQETKGAYLGFFRITIHSGVSCHA